ncbi:chemotaxis protein CheB [Deinococcus hopiensis]|uniref:protein-glutamate methylesterase n=1 Tax=Deinococcus hopiensis KR-140 TaxID=695939 RepID=A0A1W1UTW0_9DEIO|nr:chemotaxis protein CheB [Deinococcus hopiensis]SMB84542.1 two-component system, chemotaxis family, response regulator CheB [Deinococcus hopiensis KR-140]
MPQSPLIVIGASAGGIPALQKLCSQLPPDFPAPILIVQHLQADHPSLLPEILGRSGPLPTRHPQHGEALQSGVIYLAPPNHHLLVEPGYVAVTKGPKENRSRPSIDALFRSAAYLYGPQAIGVVLTGMLDDGSSGLYNIKRRGGIAIVQDPLDAEFDSMPRSALEAVDVDYVVPLIDLAPLLNGLVRNMHEGRETNVMNDEELQRLEIEVGIAQQDSALKLGVTKLGVPSLLTCPECHGVLVQIKEGKTMRYRCHTGHAYTGNVLLSEVSKSVEDKAYQMLRAMEEEAILLRTLGEQCKEAGQLDQAQALFTKADEVLTTSESIRDLALGQERLSVEKVVQATADD